MYTQLRRLYTNNNIIYTWRVACPRARLDSSSTTCMGVFLFSTMLARVYFTDSFFFLFFSPRRRGSGGGGAAATASPEMGCGN